VGTLPLADLYGQISGAIRRELRSIRSAPERADLFQEAWCRFMMIRSQLEAAYDPARGNWSSLVRTAARNVAIDCRRRRPRLHLVALSEERLRGIAVEPVVQSGIPDVENARRSLHRALRELRRRVAPSNYELFALHWLQGYRAGEIPIARGMSQSKVQKHLDRMMVKLRSIMRRHSSDAARPDPRGTRSRRKCARGGGAG
jgi:RNA polymerase sigma factor (sigma-70 family)